MAASPALSPFVASPQHPTVSSPAGFGFHARQASLSAALTPAGFNNAPSPATIFLQHGSHTPGAGTGIALPPHLLGGAGAATPSRPAPSQAGSGMSSSFGVTAMDAPNEARRLIRLLVETEGQGRLSLVRIAREVEGLQQEVQDAFTSTGQQADSAARLADLLATLDELQLSLARTGLGSLKLDGSNYSSGGQGIQSHIASTANDVQTSFKHRQRIRDAGSVARSVLS